MQTDLKSILTEDDEAVQREPAIDLDLFNSSSNILKGFIHKIKELKADDKDVSNVNK